MRLDSIDVTVIKDRIRISEKYRDEKFIAARRPDKMLQWYRGDHYAEGMPPAGVNKMDQVVVNLSLVNAIVKVATLGYGLPVLNVNPENRASVRTAQGEKRLLQHTWRQIQAVKATRRTLLDSKVVGTGVVGTGWRYLTETREYDDQIPQGPGLVQRVKDWLSDKQETRTLREFVIADHPVVRHVLPTNILFDPDSPADDIQRGWWIAEKVTRPLRVMREDPKYKSVAHRLKGSFGGSEWREGLRDGGNDDHLRTVTYYVIYMRDAGIRVEYTEEIDTAGEVIWVGDELGIDYPVDERGRAYFPYALLSNYPDMDSHYAISDVEVTETQQQEIDIGRSMLARQRRTSGTLYGYDKAALDQEDLGAIEQGKPNALIPMKLRPGMKPSDLLAALERQDAAPEIYSTLQMSKDDMSELPGITAFQRAQPLETQRLATEIMQVAAGGEARAAYERQSYEMFISEVAQQVARLQHQWGTEPVEMNVGTEEAHDWQQYTGTELVGDYTYVVEPISMDPPQSELQEQKWQGRIAVLMPMVEMGLNIAPVVEQYLQSFDFERVQEVIQNLGQAMQQMGGGEDQAAALMGALGAGGQVG